VKTSLANEQAQLLVSGLPLCTVRGKGWRPSSSSRVVVACRRRRELGWTAKPFS
jgi:hypothetical protein